MAAQCESYGNLLSKELFDKTPRKQKKLVRYRFHEIFFLVRKIIGSKQKVLKLGTELFAWNSSPDESQRTKAGHQTKKIFTYNIVV